MKTEVFGPSYELPADPGSDSAVGAASIAPGAAAQHRRGAVIVEITPSGAFAATALAAALLWLAFASGRRWAWENPPSPAVPAAATTLEQARTQTPLRYDALPVDRGAADLKPSGKQD